MILFLYYVTTNITFLYYVTKYNFVIMNALN